MHFKKQQNSGFTLVELVVVIVILGILAAVAVPKFVDMGSDAQTKATLYDTAVTDQKTERIAACTALKVANGSSEDAAATACNPT